VRGGVTVSARGMPARHTTETKTPARAVFLDHRYSDIALLTAATRIEFHNLHTIRRRRRRVVSTAQRDVF